MAISQNSALFALLGTVYGGNGQSTFGLPDLRGRVAVGWGGAANGNSSYVIGQVGGTENTTLLQSNMPIHTHTAVVSGAPSVAVVVNSGNATDPVPTSTSAIAAPGTGSSRSFSPVNGFISAAPNVTLVAGSATATAGSLAVTNAVAGGSLPFSNLQPYLAITYIIALSGVFPSRN